MKNVMRWIKANPISVAAGAVLVVMLAYTFVLGSLASSFQNAVAEQARKTAEIEGLMNTQVTVRPVNPGDPEISKPIVVNPVAIQELEQFYGRIKGEAESAQQYLIHRNVQDHSELEPGLFPGPRVDGPRKHSFRQRYRSAFVAMLGAYDEANPGVPRLNAGAPPDPQDIDDVLKNLDAEFAPAASMRTGAPEEGEARVAEQRVQELQRAQQDAVRDILHRAAQRIHIYTSMPEPGQPAFPNDFAFTVGPWSDETVRLDQITIEDMWEGQMSLWVQEDIVRAIALANQVWDPNTNVMTAPIKRLIHINVLPEHVGITKARPSGLAANVPTRRPGAGAMMDPMMGMPGMGLPGMGMPGMGPGMGMPGMGGAMGGELAEEVLDPNQPIKPNFLQSRSGRRSNPLYDVRLAEVKMVVDARQFPDIFAAFHNVNFMTVLEMKMRDVDEYQALAEGYVYAGDSVEVTLLIESIWLRQWTAELMPKTIRVWLGIDPDENAQPADMEE